MSAKPTGQLARPQTALSVKFAELGDYFLTDLFAYANGSHQLPIFMGFAIFASEGMSQVHVQIMTDSRRGFKTQGRHYMPFFTILDSTLDGDVFCDMVKMMRNTCLLRKLG